MTFSEEYAVVRARGQTTVAERQPEVPERVLQGVWYDRLFSEEGLHADDGRPIRILSPGWWNHSEGPDFRQAQIEFGGRLLTGDVEIHFNHAAWTQHGHNQDGRYDNVILIVVLETTPPSTSPTTSAGKRIPTISLKPFLNSDLRKLAEEEALGQFSDLSLQSPGRCAEISETNDSVPLVRLLTFAGQWRLLNKARTLRERMDRVGPDQAVYESVLAACGFSHFKYHFRVLGQQLPYERARQLAQDDPLVLETAYLQLAGLLPELLPEGSSALPHFSRLRALRRDKLAGLRTLPLVWRRTGVRPSNYPERRLAGAARFIARTSQTGLMESLENVWRQDFTAIARRKAFEQLFPSATGFWSTRCCWTGTKLSKPIAPIGTGRIRSIIGNVFLPAGLASARMRKDRIREECIYDFLMRLPKESDNRIVTAMEPRLFPQASLRLTFLLQQGMLQLYQDWCELNPSCRNCAVITYLSNNSTIAEGAYAS